VKKSLPGTVGLTLRRAFRLDEQRSADYPQDMPNRSRKRQPRMPDPNLFAIGILEAATGEVIVPKPDPVPDGKDPAAVALGRKGGLKGGPARAQSMTKKQRIASAKKAAAARWAGKKS